MGNRKLKAALYGGPGSGKSFLAAQLPGAVILDTEEGTDWLLKASEDSGIALDNPEFVKVETISQAEARLKRALGDPSVESIVIDTLTELFQLYVAEQVNGSTSIPISVYGDATKWARDWLLKLRKSDKHVVLVCGLREKEKDNTVLMRPDLTPRLSAAVRSWLEVIMYLDRLPTPTWRATAYTLPQALRWTKDRTGSIGNITNPTMAKILTALNEAALPKAKRKKTARSTVVSVKGITKTTEEEPTKKKVAKTKAKKKSPKKAVAVATEDGLVQAEGGKSSILTITTPGPPRLTDEETEELLKTAGAMVDEKPATKKAPPPKKKKATKKKATKKKTSPPKDKPDVASVPRIISLIQE